MNDKIDKHIATERQTIAIVGRGRLKNPGVGGVQKRSSGDKSTSKIGNKNGGSSKGGTTRARGERLDSERRRIAPEAKFNTRINQKQLLVRGTKKGGGYRSFHPREGMSVSGPKKG